MWLSTSTSTTSRGLCCFLCHTAAPTTPTTPTTTRRITTTAASYKPRMLIQFSCTVQHCRPDRCRQLSFISATMSFNGQVNRTMPSALYIVVVRRSLQRRLEVQVSQSCSVCWAMPTKHDSSWAARVKGAVSRTCRLICWVSIEKDMHCTPMISP